MANYSSGLQYLHPHMETSIIDNSTYTETVTVSNGTKLFMPFFAGKGLDNTLQTFSSQAQLLAEHGIPNFKEHGQAYYNALNFARNGGLVYGMRLLPESATYANQAVFVNFGKGVTGGDAIVEEDPLTKRYVVFATDDEEQDFPSLEPMAEGEVEGGEQVEQEEDGSLKVALMKSLEDPRSIPSMTADAKEFPIIAIYAKGRGEYGNKLAVSLEVETSLADSYEFVVYNLRVFEVAKGGNILVEGPYQVSLFPEAVNAAGTSLFITNVIERYSSYIKVAVNESNIDAVYDRLQQLHDEEQEQVKAEALENGTEYVEEEFVPFAQDVLGLGAESNSVIYSILEGGFDGGSGKNGKLTNDEKIHLLIAAFSGQQPYDSSIAHKREFPFDVMLDADFPDEVKQEMAALASKRGDCMAFLDCGVGASNAIEAVALRPQVDSPYSAIYGQSATILDSFNNVYIPVTMTYFLAAKIPANDATYGIQYPLAGPTRGIVTGFQSLSFNPYSEDKERLYKNKINYLEQDYKQSKFMSQLTAQSKTSALSNINNVRVLMRMVRDVEEIADGYFFEFATETVLSNLQSVINNNLSYWVSNGTCKIAEATVYQNEYDEIQKIIRVRIELIFTSVIERIIIEFNVGN